MKNRKSKEVVNDFIKEKVVDILKNPQKMMNLPQKAKDFISSAADLADVSKLPERIKNSREESDKKVLRIMFLLLSVEKNISAEQQDILKQIAQQFGNSCKIEYSEVADTVRKLQYIRENNSFEEFTNTFIDEVRADCNDIQKKFIGLTILSSIRRAYVIWIVSALSVNVENYSQIRHLLEKLSYFFKPTRTDMAASTALYGKKDDNYFIKLLKHSNLLFHLADAVGTAIEYDFENLESYIQIDFIQAVENDCKLILNLSSLAESEKNPELKKKIEEAIEQITAYLLDRIAPYNVSSEFELDDEK